MADYVSNRCWHRQVDRVKDHQGQRGRQGPAVLLILQAVLQLPIRCPQLLRDVGPDQLQRQQGCLLQLGVRDYRRGRRRLLLRAVELRAIDQSKGDVRGQSHQPARKRRRPEDLGTVWLRHPDGGRDDHRARQGSAVRHRHHPRAWSGGLVGYHGRSTSISNVSHACDLLNPI